jgi:hypothetical protein
MFFAFVPLSWNARSFFALEVKGFVWRSIKLLVPLQAEQFVIDSRHSTTVKHKVQLQL